ncbi:MAG: hypothetical protein AAF605_04630 [Myxococcota bacterium]
MIFESERVRSRLIRGALVLGLGCVGCGETLDVSRDPTRRSTGEMLFDIFCERVAAAESVPLADQNSPCEGPPEDVQLPSRLSTLFTHRVELVSALDQVFPASDTESLRELLGRLIELALPPDRSLAVFTERLAERSASVSENPEALQSLSRVSHRIGYRTRSEAFGLFKPLFRAPDLLPTVAGFVRALDDNPSLRQRWFVFLDVLALELDRLEWSGEPSHPLSAREWLQSETTAEAGEPIWMVSRDLRGLAVPRRRSDETLPPPWIDVDLDGLADADVWSRFVDAEGAPIEVSTPFLDPGGSGLDRDLEGLALSEDGEPLYVYRDAGHTVAAALLEEITPVTDAILSSVPGWVALSGPSQEVSIDYGDSNYRTHQRGIADGSLSDLVYAGGEIIAQPSAIQAFDALEQLLATHEAALAALVELVLFIDREVEKRPNLELEQPSNFVDDILRVGAWIAGQPGLTEALLRSFADPRSLRLGPIYAGLMRHRDEVRLDPGSINRVRSDLVLGELVDRDASNSAANQSLFQRSAALIHDLDGARLCNKRGAVLRATIGDSTIRWPIFGSYDECELFAVDNLAELYAQSVLGTAQIELLDSGLVGLLSLLEAFGITSIDQLLETESGIDGLTTRPTPEALNRLVFSEPNTFIRDLIEPISTRDGLLAKDVHPETSVAWEIVYEFADGREPASATFYEAMTPLLDAFERFDRREQDRFLFGETITALHVHWSAPDQGDDPTTQSDDPAAPLFAEQSGVVRYEPVVIESFDAGELFSRLHDLVVGLESIAIGEDDGVTALAGWIESILDPERHPALVNRLGEASTPSSDGSRQVAWTPVYLMIDAFARIDADFAANSQHDVKTEWRDASRALASHVFETQRDPTISFLRRSSVSLLSSVLSWMRDVLRNEQREGTLAEWRASLTPRFQRFWSDPLLGSSIEFLGEVAGDPETKARVLRLVEIALERTESQGRASLVSLLDTLKLVDDQLTLRPLLEEFAKIVAADMAGFFESGSSLDTQNGTLELALDLIDRVDAADPERTIGTLLARSIELPVDPRQGSPIEVIADVYCQVNRVEPGSAAPLTPDDWRLILGSTAELLTDSERGLERFYRVLDSRSFSP